MTAVSGAVPLHATLAAARDRLIASGVTPREADLDVQLFARTILGWDTARFLVERTSPTPDRLEPRFSEWVARRATHEPSAYVVRVREFWGLDFRVTPSALIPRPETELIVQEGVRLCRGFTSPRVADIGTGSGCIAVSLAHSVPGCTLVATDIAVDAVALARENASTHGVADRIEFVAASYLDGVGGRFDIIAANPPYVRDGDKAGLSPDVRHEPDVALFGGANGLRNIQGVLETAIDRLSPGGWLLMEFGYGQEDDVRALIGKRASLRLDRIVDDLQGIPRMAVVQRVAD
jgi:release factor glutamine methyltransferase